MSLPDKRNLAASVLARLLELSRRTGEDYQVLLSAFAQERFLYRLGISPSRDRFVLKGATLLRLWAERPYRATRDLDLLRQGPSSVEAVRGELEVVLRVPVDPDGLVFETGTIRLEPIRPEEDFAGTRVIMVATCERARIPMQVDIGVGDAVWPAPERRDYPTLLGFPAPSVLAYPPEAVIAEKLEAMIVLGDRNSRIKDYFDLHYLAGHFSFDRVTLVEAIRRTLGRRATPIPEQAPFGLTEDYWRNPSRAPQLRAFARRAHLSVGSSPENDLLEVIRPLLLPVLEDLRTGRGVTGTWPPGGPWQSRGPANP